MNNKKLIITTGDISDVDGFIALAEYAKSGADVLFIMNYPAYLHYEYNTYIGSKDDYLFDTSINLNDINKPNANLYKGFEYGLKIFLKAIYQCPIS